jgi:hypothetical protein
MVCNPSSCARARAPVAELTFARLTRRLWYAAVHVLSESGEFDADGSSAPHGYALRASDTGDYDFASWFTLEPRARAGCKCGFCRALDLTRRSP